jgi:hypothetical protein
VRTAPFDIFKALAGHPLTTPHRSTVTSFALHDHFKEKAISAETFAYTVVIGGVLRLANALGELKGLPKFGYDLQLLLPEPVKHKGFLNVYRSVGAGLPCTGNNTGGFIYLTEAAAREAANKGVPGARLISVAVPVEWEEEPQ